MHVRNFMIWVLEGLVFMFNNMGLFNDVNLFVNVGFDPLDTKEMQ